MTYVYKCRVTGHKFEVTQRLTDPVLTECPRCGGEVHRVPQLPQVVYYGEGFHCNDYGTRFKVD